MTTTYDVQQSWTVGGKTFTDKAAADEHALKLHRRDQAIEALVAAGVKRHDSGNFDRNCAASLAPFMQEHLDACAEALAILRGERDGSNV
jgi:hypothetical protein